MTAGTYGSTYATVNTQEYYAEGVQDFYDVNVMANSNFPNQAGRAALLTKDPTLYNLLSGLFLTDAWRPGCGCNDQDAVNYPLAGATVTSSSSSSSSSSGVTSSSSSGSTGTTPTATQIANALLSSGTAITSTLGGILPGV